MKKYLFCLIAGLISTSVLAGELQMPPSALSNVPPNDLRVVAVAEFSTAGGYVGQNPKEMTVRDLISNRPTIGSTTDKRLCVVESVSNPERKHGGMCVSAQTSPATVTVATFKHAAGAPITGERTIAVNDFVSKAASVQAKDATNFDCIVKDGKNIGVCVIASSN